LTGEKIAFGGRNVIVAIGSVIGEYERHDLLQYANLLEALTRGDINISDELRQLVQDSAMEDHGPYFDTHLDFKRTSKYGGSRSSIVCENSFADEVINLEYL
jgi:hypothetical protein